MPAPKKQPDKENITKLNISYAPVSGLETVTASGSMSSLTPDGLVNIAFYVERQPFPTSASLSVKEDGSAEEGEDVFENGPGLVREIVRSVLIRQRTARFLIQTLTEALDDLNDDEGTDATAEDTITA